MYVVPQFPLTVNVWRAATPIVNPPDVITVGNLTMGRRVTTQWVNAFGLGVPAIDMFLLLPPLTDVRGWNHPGGPDTIEAPGGSGRFYLVALVDDSGKGFSNEHRVAVLIQSNSWPFPTP
jgi:hypothetical protein